MYFTPGRLGSSPDTASCLVKQASPPLDCCILRPIRFVHVPVQASYVGDSCCAAVGNGDLVLISAGPTYYSACVSTVAQQARQAGLQLCPLLCPLLFPPHCAVFCAVFVCSPLFSQGLLEATVR